MKQNRNRLTGRSVGRLLRYVTFLPVTLARNAVRGRTGRKCIIARRCASPKVWLRQ